MKYNFLNIFSKNETEDNEKILGASTISKEHMYLMTEKDQMCMEGPDHSQNAIHMKYMPTMEAESRNDQMKKLSKEMICIKVKSTAYV